MLWSIIDSCQNRVHNVSADQCQMTVSQTQVYNSLRWHVFLKFSAGHILFSFGSQAQVPFFRKISVCFLFMAKAEFLHQKDSKKSHGSFAFDGGYILDVHEWRIFFHHFITSFAGWHKRHWTACFHWRRASFMSVLWNKISYSTSPGHYLPN